MSIERISYPLPAIVNGFACLNVGEMEMAKKNIDPARPKDGPNGRDAAPPPSAKSSGPTQTAQPAQVDPQRLAVAAKAAATAAASFEAPMLSYAPGAVRLAATAPGAVYSVNV